MVDQTEKHASLGHLDQIMTDPVILREAGEGWRDGGPDPVLLGMLALRESMVSSLAERALGRTEGPPEKFPARSTAKGGNDVDVLHDTMYLQLSGQIEEYKIQHGITGPPLPPDEL